MKKIYKKRKDEGVSPVIATILMVAITVVLAAVLYVMVIEIRPPTFDEAGGNIQSVDIKNNSAVEITFGTFTSKPSPTSVKLILEDSAGARTTLNWPDIPNADNFAMTSSDPLVSAVYRDYVPTGNEINPGDSVLVNGLSSGERYSVQMINLEGTEFKLGGDTEFSMP